MRISIEDNGTEVKVKVEDSGPGVGKDDKGSLFQLFNFSESSQKGISGHGLGLAMSKRVIESVGG